MNEEHDEQTEELKNFIESSVSKLETKLDKIMDMLNDRLPKIPVIPGMPKGEPVEAPKGYRTAPFSFVDSGCVLNGDKFKYCFPIRVGNGGEARDIVLEDNQQIHVSSGGKAVHCTITDFARFTADRGANTLFIIVRDGGIATATKNGAWLDDMKVRDSGTVIVASGGSLGIAEVSSGGRIVLDKGSWVEQIDVFSNGMVCVNDKDVGMSSLTIYHGGIVRFANKEAKEAMGSHLTVSSGGVVEYLNDEEGDIRNDK